MLLQQAQLRFCGTFFVPLQPLKQWSGLSLVPQEHERKVRATQSIAFLNGKLGATSGFKVTENNRRKARVKRWGKSPPGATATWRAAPPASCKVKYIGI